MSRSDKYNRNLQRIEEKLSYLDAMVREERANLREKNKKLSGLDLVNYLESYAATGKDYVKILTSIINQNSLTDFDNSNLMNTNRDSSLTL